MMESLEIKKEAVAGSLRVKVAGRIDAYWSEHLDRMLKEEINAGQYAIVLDFSEVSYISSAGIRVIIGCYRVIRKLHGSLSLINASGSVAAVLEMSGLTSIVAGKEIKGEKTTEPERSAGDEGGLRLSVRVLDPGMSFTCMTVGKPGGLFLSGYSPGDCRQISLRRDLFGIGSGAIGNDFGNCRGRFGEFLALAGAAVYHPTDGSNRPDYILPAGHYQPEMTVLYGVLWEGGFSHVVDFEFPGEGGEAPLSSLMDGIMDLLPGFGQAATVMIGETSGLVGATINRSPFHYDYGSGKSPFSFPEIRDGLYITTEKIHRRMLSVTAGIVSRTAAGPLQGFVRPLSSSSKLQGHFHASVLPFRPLRRQMTDLAGTVHMLYEEGHISAILHLMNDEREINGIGESGFVRGACWVGKISEVTGQG